ncbi:MAG: SpoIIIAH-like family protein [Acutalibacteraceae bacterium]
MKFHKRQLILASLVTALGVAVYLNWQFSDTKGIGASNVLESTRELGEARYVNSSNLEETDDKENSSKKLSKESMEFFVEAEENRQKAREESEEKLKNLMSDSKIPEETKKEIKDRLDDISQNIQKESNIENLIQAKGFGKCMVYLQNGECSVIVSPKTLNESSVIIIRDIVSGQAGVNFEKIKITESK